MSRFLPSIILSSRLNEFLTAFEWFTDNSQVEWSVLIPALPLELPGIKKISINDVNR